MIPILGVSVAPGPPGVAPFVDVVRTSAVLLTVVSLVWLLDPGVADAQRERRGRRVPAAEAPAPPPPSRDAEEGRRLFIAGTQAVEAGLWADAIESFERAYELTNAPSALRNVALALRALGRHREARDAFERLLREHTLDPETRRDLETLRAEEAARLGALVVEGLDDAEAAILHLDGAALADTGARPLELELDPATHVLVAERVGFQRFVWEGEISEGARRRVEVVFAPLVAPADDTWWHVLLASSAAVLVGVAGVVTGWALWQDAQVSPSYALRVSL